MTSPMDIFHPWSHILGMSFAFIEKIDCHHYVKLQRLAMARDGLMARTTLLLLQVLHVLFQSFIHSTRVKNDYHTYGLEDFFFSIFDDQNLGCCCFFFSLLLFRLQSTSWKERVFSLECFCNWRNDFLDLSRSLLLHCVVLVIFDPLYIYIAVVSQEDLSEVLWALPDEMFPELPAIAKTEYRPSWSHPSCVPSVPTYPPYKQRIRVCFKSPFEHPCLNSASAASTFISDWRCHSGTV